MITIDHLHKSYGTKDQRLHVLKDITFTLPDGCMACLLGPSGSGKSTLLNILGGIETMDEGDIIVAGNHLAPMNKKQLELYRRKQLGFVFQFYNLVENLTVRENILTGAYLSDDPLDVDALAEELGIADQLHKFPWKYPAAKPSGCPSPGPWRKSRHSLFATSPPVPWTTKAPRRFCT